MATPFPIRPAKKSTLERFGVVVPNPDPYPPIAPDELDPRTKYPFLLLNVGESFLVPLNSAPIQGLRTRASQAHYAKRYRVVVHLDHGCYEVVRIR